MNIRINSQENISIICIKLILSSLHLFKEQGNHFVMYILPMFRLWRLYIFPAITYYVNLFKVNNNNLYVALHLMSYPE